MVVIWISSKKQHSRDCVDDTVATVAIVFTAKPKISEKHGEHDPEWIRTKLGDHYHV